MKSHGNDEVTHSFKSSDALESKVKYIGIQQKRPMDGQKAELTILFYLVGGHRDPTLPEVQRCIGLIPGKEITAVVFLRTEGGSKSSIVDLNDDIDSLRLSAQSAPTASNAPNAETDGKNAKQFNAKTADDDDFDNDDIDSPICDGETEVEREGQCPPKVDGKSMSLITFKQFTIVIKGQEVRSASKQYINEIAELFINRH